MENTRMCSVCEDPAEKEPFIKIVKGKEEKIFFCSRHKRMAEGNPPKKQDGMPSCCGGVPLDANGHCPICGGTLD